ncbi:hypothetical protein [Limimaricola hongkongensis]|uniref:Sulfotransferase domain-containing protein n=1 Tax=Limimaricola hongkongensis DSM 17492 TaxID=1122180 RepID=A0A017H7W2_9RHOB|nr:hypothetical protein [Limimaricola hongkongensis]EYD70567.1 hypothetical protein Lokhon_02201 [Limimaricola hongkongensis DSM 17492]
MRTLYIHIGAHRTATTSVQKFLQANFVNLQRLGYFHPFNAGRHVALMNRIFSGEAQVADVAADITARADGKAHDLHSVILSDEDICMRPDLSVLAQFRAHFDVKIVFALRRQDLWLESWYLQNVKWQWNPSLAHLTFAEFLERREDFAWIHYDAYLRHVEELFGRDNVLVYAFDKAQMPDGPVAAFCDRIGLTARDTLAPAPHTNTSMSPAMSEFMRVLPLDEVPPVQRKFFERACAQVDETRTQKHGRQSNLLMDADTRARVLDLYAAGNAAVAARHFGRETLFLDPLPARDAPLAEMRLPAEGYAVMQDYVADFVRAMALVRAEEAAAAAAAERK